MNPRTFPSSGPDPFDSALRRPKPLEQPPDRIRDLTEDIFRRGAVILRNGFPPVLVGDLCWNDENRIWWFPAFGDREDDAAEFRFHYAHATASRVIFEQATRNVLEMVLIEEAALADPADYRVGWELWLQIAPIRRRMIERSYQQFEQT